MGRRVGLGAIVVVLVSSLLWSLLVVGTRPVSAQAYWESAESVQGAAIVNPPITSTKEQPAQQGKTAQNELVPNWLTLSLLLLGCFVLLAVLGFLLWIGGLLPWRRRGHPAGWGYQVLLTLLAVLAGVVALTPEVFTVFTLPSWIRAVLLAAALVLALAVPVVTLRSAKLEKERGWVQQVRGLLQVPLGTDGRLPRLSVLSPYWLGISPSRYGSVKQRGDDPYVSRVIDNTLDQVLTSERFVLVVGDSKAGKSRTAYEAATRLQHAGRLQDPPVLVPKSTDLLEQLLDLDPPLDLHPEPALLWLDDLTENALAALTLDLLDRLTRKMIVLGALTAQRHDRIMNSDSEIGRNARLALRRATVIRLDADLTKEERAEAEQKYPEERFEASIGEQLVAVDQLTTRYDDAHAGANPHGWAIVQAVIDWTRMDVGRRIRQHELMALCPLYLHELRPHIKHDDKDHAEALGWACQPVVSHIALLEEQTGDLVEPSYTPFDYLVALADGQGGRLSQPILDSGWDKVLALVSPSEALRTGVSAIRRQLRLHAQKTFTAVAAAGDQSEAVSEAEFDLGLLLQAQGNLAEAKAAYQLVIDSGNREVASTAAVTLGLLLKEEGNLKGAKANYQLAINSGNRAAAAMAAGGLGELLKEEGDLKGAKAAYKQAMESGNLEIAPLAALQLGELLLAEGDFVGAKLAYRRATEGGDSEVVPMAAFSLGLILQEEGDLEGAKAAYRGALNSGHVEAAPMAANNLGQLLEKQGDLEGAKAAYRRAIDSDNAEAAPMAALSLGSLLWEQGDLEGAKAAYQRAVNSNDPGLAALASLGLTEVLKSAPPPAAS